MNWLQKTAQIKDMPLPFPYPGLVSDKSFTKNTIGLNRIDHRMTQETADREKERNPSYLGSGAFGVIIDLGGGKVGKYITDYTEADFADEIKRNPVPCVVKIHSVTQVQQEVNSKVPNLWLVIEDKVRTLSPEDARLAWEIRGWRFLAAPDNGGYEEADVRNSYQDAITKYPDKKQFIDDLFKFGIQMVQYGICSHDVKGDNIGYDQNNNLVLIDLGFSFKANR